MELIKDFVIGIIILLVYGLILSRASGFIGSKVFKISENINLFLKKISRRS